MFATQDSYESVLRNGKIPMKFLTYKPHKKGNFLQNGDKKMWPQFNQNIIWKYQTNCQPISQLKITWKILRRLLYEELFNNQSGFRRDSSCFNQLLPITHERHKSFDNYLEVILAFLHKSKASVTVLYID